VADTGCTELLLKQSSAHFLQDRTPDSTFAVEVANKSIMKSTERGLLRIPTPSGDIAVPGYIFPDIVLSHNLAGLSNLCNMGCTVTLTNTCVDITKDGTSIWQCTKEPHEKL
jgi:hypothetical protein